MPYSLADYGRIFTQCMREPGAALFRGENYDVLNRPSYVGLRSDTGVAVLHFDRNIKCLDVWFYSSTPLYDVQTILERLPLPFCTYAERFTKADTKHGEHPFVYLHKPDWTPICGTVSGAADWFRLPLFNEQGNESLLTFGDFL